MKIMLAGWVFFYSFLPRLNDECLGTDTSQETKCAQFLAVGV